MRRSARLPLAELQPYLLEVPAAMAVPPAEGWAVSTMAQRGTPSGSVRSAHPTGLPLDWRQVFGNDHPVHIEVGFGKGLFLVTAGQAQPHTNFLGIEIDRKYQLFTATRLAKRRLANVRLICGDARQVLAVVLESSVQAVHVYFPDPWWKTRHRKRRLFTADFAGQCARVLQPGGLLHVMTDVETYFREIRTILDRQAFLREDPSPSTLESDYLTNFDRKYRQAGKTIFRVNFEKIANCQLPIVNCQLEKKE